MLEINTCLYVFYVKYIYIQQGIFPNFILVNYFYDKKKYKKIDYKNWTKLKWIHTEGISF